MGVQLIGRRGDDGRLLRTARWLMERVPGNAEGAKVTDHVMRGPPRGTRRLPGGPRVLGAAVDLGAVVLVAVAFAGYDLFVAGSGRR